MRFFFCLFRVVCEGSIILPSATGVALHFQRPGFDIECAVANYLHGTRDHS